jgi:hypothetical protein
MSTNIFIDTSTYLSFYSVSNDDLDQLEKIVDLIGEGRIKILVTSQVQREWIRNRDNKLSEAINNIEKLSFKSPSIPRFMGEYVEVADLRRALILAEKARISAVSRAKVEAVTATTNADKLIQRIFLSAGVQADDAKVLASAEKRMALGDLPGKPGSLGDRLNWEHLLASDITDGDLHIISKDGDYFSPLDGKLPKYALYREWVERKNGKLSVHHELKPFLVSKFPQFHFRPDPRARKDVDVTAIPDAPSYSRKIDYWAAIREAAIRDLEQAENSSQLEKAIQGLEKLIPHLSEADLLRICRFVSKGDAFHDYDGEEEIGIFFENIVPKVSHLLDRKDAEALDQTFGIEIHPEEFQIEEDPLFPDYGQMDLDLLEERVDEELEKDPVPAIASDEPF